MTGAHRIAEPPFVLAALDDLLASRVGQDAERALLAEMGRGIGLQRVGRLRG